MNPLVSPQRTAKEQFDRQAAHYNAQWNRWTEESLDWLLAHAECRNTDIVLDVATGTGFTALAFAPRVRSVTGLDVSVRMLEQARQRAEAQGITNFDWIEGAAEAMPFAEARFDLVTCRIAPHHFLSIPQFLSETRRVLKSGGRLLLADTSVPVNPIAAAWQNEVEALRDPSHVRNHTCAEWQRYVEQAGLVIEAIDDTQGGVPITLNDWLIKAGCTPEQAESVRRRFATAPNEAIEAFHIERRADGDTGFVWQRVVLKAIKR